MFKRFKLRRRVQRPRRPASKEYLTYKEEARELVKQKIEHWNAFYNYTFGRIAIKNTKSRWGSCSKKGNLNFNYHIVFLPQHLADYLIVHELCHLGQFDHSQKFWNLVAQTVPDWEKCRGELRVWKRPRASVSGKRTDVCT